MQESIQLYAMLAGLAGDLRDSSCRLVNCWTASMWSYLLYSFFFLSSEFDAEGEGL